jgi:predicted small secreted protein
MNNMVKLTAVQRIAGIIALVALIGFSMAACDTGSGSGGGSGGGGNPFRGTWSGDVDGNNMTLQMTDSMWSATHTTGSGGNWTGLTGFVSYSGKTATLQLSGGDVFITGTISEDGKTLTVRTRDGATGNLTKTGSLPDW